MMNLTPDIKSRVFTILTLFVIALSGLIMFMNTYRHPTENIYDFGSHNRSFLLNEHYAYPVTTYSLSYNSPIYYYIVGKLNFLVEKLTFMEIDPNYIARLLQMLFYLTTAFLFAFKLLPKFNYSDFDIFLFTLMLFVIPNIFLAQVMSRPDHLLFISINLLFFFWFYYDYPRKLVTSKGHLVIWSLCLIISANSRHFAIIFYLIFFGFGVFYLIRDGFLANSFTRSRKIFVIVWIFLTIALSGSFYIARYFMYGKILSMPDKSYSNNYKTLTRYFGLDRRLEMFFNMEFNKLFEEPNRLANYGEQIRKGHVSIMYDLYSKCPPKIDKDMFEDKMLNSLDEEKQQRLQTYYTAKDDGYYLNRGLSTKAKLDCLSLIVSSLNYNNSFFPRYYGDMWGDHWLVYSAYHKNKDDKVTEKRIVFILAIPFTLLYFFCAFLYAFKCIKYFIVHKKLKLEYISGLLFVLSFLLFVYFVMFRNPIPAKNSTIKFLYTMAYNWFPFFCVIDFLRDKKILKIIVCIYTVVLFIFCLPLSYFGDPYIKGLTSDNEIEAEKGYVEDGGIYRDNKEASGRRYVLGGSVKFKVEVEKTGVYVLKTRTLARNANSDSYFIRVDNGEEYYWDLETSPDWEWKTSPIKWKLNKGFHIIEVDFREPALLDKIKLEALTED